MIASAGKMRGGGGVARRKRGGETRGKTRGISAGDAGASRGGLQISFGAPTTPFFRGFSFGPLPRPPSSTRVVVCLPRPLHFQYHVPVPVFTHVRMRSHRRSQDGYSTLPDPLTGHPLCWCSHATESKDAE